MKQSLTTIARNQHGVFSRAQALAAGYTDRQIAVAIERRAWLRCCPGVYRAAGAPMTWRARAWCALLAAGVGAALAFGVAARIHRIDGAPAYEAMDLCVDRSRRPRVVPGARLHRVPLPSTAVMHRSGLIVTTPARTVVDLARGLPVAQGSHIVGDALRTGVVTPAALQRELDAARYRAGADAARQAASLANPALESVLEGELAPLLMAAGVVVVPQFEVYARGVFVARLDFGVPELKLGFEADGYGSHGRRGQFERDHERAALLRLAGWTIVAFTAAQIRERPAWVTEVARRLAEERRSVTEMHARGA